MPPRKKEAAPENVNKQLDQELAENKLTDFVQLAGNMVDMNVECRSTGLPQLDVILHPKKKGFPLQRDCEFFSKKPESGKTSLGMQIIHSFQQQFLRTASVDVERTQTDELFEMHKVITDPFQDDRICALRLMRNQADNLAAEEFLGNIKTMSQLFDLVVVDSLATFETKANLDKEVDDAKGVGGCSKLLSEFFRGNITKRAGILWINQTRQKIGASMPGMGEQFVRPGGRALEFYASIILELTMIEKIKGAEGEPPIGMKIQAYTEKNKIAPPFRKCLLTYLFGKGFSAEFDYFDLALKAKIIEKSGSWFSFKSERLGQGAMNVVNLMEQNRNLFNDIKKAVDGEDVAEAEVKETTKNPPPVQEAA